MKRVIKLCLGMLFAFFLQGVIGVDAAPVIPDTQCQECHGIKGFAVPVGVHGEAEKRVLHVDEDLFRTSVHGRLHCLDCHVQIIKLPHTKGVFQPVDCVSCHLTLKKESPALMAQINASLVMSGLSPNAVPTPARANRAASFYRDSIHAQPRKHGDKGANAECKACHGTHEVFRSDDWRASTHRLSSPGTCGVCHAKALELYRHSVHGAALQTPWKGKSAVCTDCHSSHQINDSKSLSVRRLITENCGECHAEALSGYLGTYHGQLSWLGGGKAARCYDCHAPHDTRRVDDPLSKTHPDNLLKSCRECHKEATEHFVSFRPHGTTHDFRKYPEMWIAGKVMVGLVALVLIFFYVHSGLWFYRSWQERVSLGQAFRIHPHLMHEKHVMRFAWPWRVNHWLLVLSVMTLTGTGMTAMFSGSVWATRSVQLLGGPEQAAFLHRIAAVGFVMAVLGHFMVLFYKLVITRAKPFVWFGPDSLLPRKKDWEDMVMMFKWFFGKGPMPSFDRWTYWEKFDYWAVGWGLVVIGSSGIMLWFPTFFARFLPGWAFNVATIAHGMEAFLAVVTLFSIHFFNNHFRPGKFPLDIVMFVGGWSLEEFKHERPEAFRRLTEEGRLEACLVPPPSRRVIILSHVAGFTLIGIGLILLVLVVIGFLQQGVW
ncbi:MAG: hypothetical protein H7839_11935 [Magnetococcus sp. YQC-5]